MADVCDNLNGSAHELPASLETVVRSIAADHRSGAAEILNKSAELFSSLEGMGAIGYEQTRSLIRRLCDRLVSAQPYMAAMINLSRSIACAAECAAPEAILTSAARAAIEFVSRADSASAAAAVHASALIEDGMTVATHSRSSTVLNAFRRARDSGRRFSVMVTESRPLFEGRTLSIELSEADIRTVLIVDAAMSRAVERSDLVLVGADCVTREFVVNKIGTLPLALLAREYSRPIFSATDTSKFLSTPARGGVPDECRRGEVWEAAPEHVSIANPYFERCPLSLFTGVVTESGLQSIDRVLASC